MGNKVNTPAILAQNLSIGYGNNIIVEDISLTIEKGSFCTIIGPNGCGKSTILKALSRNLSLKAGSISIKGRSLQEYDTKVLSRDLAFLAQSPHIPEQFSVRELISYGRFPHTNWHGILNKTDHEVINWAMEETDILQYADRELIHLSGGERQRVWIAMALAQKAEILLLDEPTTYLDINHQFQTLELIHRLNRQMNRTILMVLHDLNQAARYSDYLYVVKGGELVTQGTPDEVITKELLRDVFSVEARVIRDQDNNCPFFIPIRGLSELPVG